MAWINYLLDWGLLCVIHVKIVVKRRERERGRRGGGEGEGKKGEKKRRDDYVSEFLWVQPNIQEDKNRQLLKKGEK